MPAAKASPRGKLGAARGDAIKRVLTVFPLAVEPDYDKSETGR